MVKAEIAVEEHHGPVIRLTCGDTTVAVYLLDETAISVNPLGEYGIDVSGDWAKFKTAIKVEEWRHEKLARY